MIEEDKWFYFLKGRKARSIDELRDILEVIDESEFKHHVNHHKNDFANWIEGVFGEKELAKNMREVSEKEGMIIILDDFIDKKHIAEEKIREVAEEAPSPPEEKQEYAPKHKHKHSFEEHPLYFGAVEEKKEDDANKGGAKEELKEDFKEDFKQGFSQNYKQDFKEADKYDFKDDFKNEIPVPEKEERKVIIPPEKKLSFDSEAGKELSEKEIKALVSEAMQVFEHHLDKEKGSGKAGEEEKLADEDEDIDESKDDETEYIPRPMRREERILAEKPESKKSLIVAEFIFGFVIGLIFGLIMLGILFNLRFT